MNSIKFTTIMFLLMLLVPSVFAANIMPLKCDGGFEPGEEVDIYVIQDMNEIVQDFSLVDVSGNNKETLTVNNNGILSFSQIWAKIKTGFYDLVADINGDGLFNNDDVHNYETGAAVPVEEVPEFGTLTAILVLASAVLFIHKKRNAL